VCSMSGGMDAKIVFFIGATSSLSYCAKLQTWPSHVHAFNPLTVLSKSMYPGTSCHHRWRIHLRYTDIQSVPNVSRPLLFMPPSGVRGSLLAVRDSIGHARHDLLCDSLSFHPRLHTRRFTDIEPIHRPEDDGATTSFSALSRSYSIIPTMMHDEDVPAHPAVGRGLH
jgi:hypothetical protein